MLLLKWNDFPAIALLRKSALAKGTTSTWPRGSSTSPATSSYRSTARLPWSGQLLALHNRCLPHTGAARSTPWLDRIGTLGKVDALLSVVRAVDPQWSCALPEDPKTSGQAGRTRRPRLLQHFPSYSQLWGLQPLLIKALLLGQRGIVVAT